MKRLRELLRRSLASPTERLIPDAGREPMGDAALKAGLLEEAVSHYRAAVLAVPDSHVTHFKLGNALARMGDHQAAADELREAIRCKPDLAAAYCNLGLSLQELGMGEEARAMLRRAVELEPENLDFATNLRIAVAHPVPLWHFSMMNDAARNDAYEAALRAAIRPGDRVLEIGSGSGLLAMMAARAGAGHVFTCEVVEPLARKAREIIAANGFGDKVSVIPKHSTQLSIPADLPDRADVLVGEIISSDLLGEGLLPSYEDAKARLLAPGARIIPARASIRGQLVAATGLEPFIRVGAVSGFDLSSFNDFSPLKVHPGEVEMDLVCLSAPFDIFHFDLQSADYFAPTRLTIPVSASHDGLCAGVLQWIRLDLGGGVVYESADANPWRAGHWQQVLHLLPNPLPLAAGDNIVVTAAHNRSNLLFHARRTGVPEIKFTP